MSNECVNELENGKSFSEIVEAMAIRFLPRFVTYSPNVSLLIDTEKYQLKTASHVEELINVFRLRYQNFLEAVKGDEATYDLDEFDHLCDHLVIIDKSTQQIIGTYRILCSDFTSKFYSATEFKIDEFLKIPGKKIELGRACIDPHYRNGQVIDLLWKGIAEYHYATGAKYMFGCSSVKTQSPQVALGIYNYLEARGNALREYNIEPLPKFKMDFSGCTQESAIEVKNFIPGLLRSYLTAGAKIIGEGAIDRDFECVDFFTLINIEEISPLFKKRYFNKE
ncbi:MAG: hypothetical protein CME62_07125 [Halobacteriovoraceae bacterium]|nr:hypothetical protein [Halobacteriovoraceae bacterium]|tara:strand:+ start:1877 stop:2716 length:840 start_codon:yes stop_codon:yes gene_type:complete